MMESHLGTAGPFPFMLIWWVVGGLVLARLLRHRWPGRPERERDAAPLPAPDSPAGDRALALLRERFARGEISREEYEERRAVLEETGASWP